MGKESKFTPLHDRDGKVIDSSLLTGLAHNSQRAALG